MAPEAMGQKEAGQIKKSSARYVPARNAVALLAVILIANIALGFPAAGNLAFLAPVAVATYRGGLRNGLPVFVLSTVVSTMILAYSGLIQHGGLIANVLIEAILLSGAMVYSERTRRNLSDTILRSRVDDLTNAQNRTSIAELGTRAVQRSIAAAEPMCVAVIDLDDFKELNDGHGHAFGDAVLKELVGTVQANLDTADRIGRTGGDEFVVVFPNRTQEEAERILRRANDQFSDRTLVAGHPITFSYGIGCPATDGFSWAILLHAADQDMYRRKAAKKKQLVRQVG